MQASRSQVAICYQATCRILGCMTTILPSRWRRPSPSSGRRPAARGPAGSPAAAAGRRAGAVRRQPRADGARQRRPRAVGRAALRPDRARADHARPGGRADELRRAAAVDPAARAARHRHHRQRADGRLLGRRDAVGARRAACRRRPDRVHGRRRRALRRRVGPLHRRPARPRSAGRADDRPAPPYRRCRSDWSAPCSRSPWSWSDWPSAACSASAPSPTPSRIGPLTQLFLPWCLVDIAAPGAPVAVRQVPGSGLDR